MPVPRSGPLTEQDYQKINDHLRTLAEAKADIDRAKLAGFECDQQDEMCRYFMERLSKVKNVYFSDRP